MRYKNWMFPYKMKRKVKKRDTFNPLTTDVPDNIENSQLIYIAVVSIRWRTVVVNRLNKI